MPHFLFAAFTFAARRWANWTDVQDIVFAATGRESFGVKACFVEMAGGMAFGAGWRLCFSLHPTAPLLCPGRQLSPLLAAAFPSLDMCGQLVGIMAGDSCLPACPYMEDMPVRQGQE